MGRIPLREGFTLMPEGEQVLRIYDIEFDEEFGKLIVKMVNAKGLTVQERFSFKDKDGNFVDGALNAFSYFARAALNDYSAEDIDPEELIDHYIKAEIVHNTVENRNDPSKTRTYANLGSKSSAEGFEEEATARALNLGRNGRMKNTAQPQAAEPAKSGLDLDALLG